MYDGHLHHRLEGECYFLKDSMLFKYCLAIPHDLVMLFQRSDLNISEEIYS